MRRCIDNDSEAIQEPEDSDLPVLVILHALNTPPELPNQVDALSYENDALEESEEDHDFAVLFSYIAKLFVEPCLPQQGQYLRPRVIVLASDAPGSGRSRPQL